MAPEYGATMGFFPVDDKTIEYFKGTGRTADEIDAFAGLLQGAGPVRHAEGGRRSTTARCWSSTSRPSCRRSPARSARRTASTSTSVKSTFTSLFSKPVAENGFAKKPADLAARVKTRDGVDLGSGDVLIAAITSCTNTSNPGVLLAAGLLAKKAVEHGLTVKPHIKTSLAPGSRVVTEYLTKAGLLPYLEKLGFNVAGLRLHHLHRQRRPARRADRRGDRQERPRLRRGALRQPQLRGAHPPEPPRQLPRLARRWWWPTPSPARCCSDLKTEPLGNGKDGQPVYLGDIWPTADEVAALMKYAIDPATFRRLYSDLGNDNPLWKQVPVRVRPGLQLAEVHLHRRAAVLRRASACSRAGTGDIAGARALGIFGDSVTTDHISPAGSIKPTSPAGKYLLEHDVAVPDFNSYGARRGNHEVMMRGTFANVRIKNLMLPLKADGTRVEGGVTLFQPAGEQLPIYDAAMKYIAAGTPTVVFGGEEYGTGSLARLGGQGHAAARREGGHRAQLRAHPPLQPGRHGRAAAASSRARDSVESLGIKGDETFDIIGLDGDIRPQQDVTLVIHRKDGSKQEVKVLLRIDTPIEVDYYRHGGILPYVLRELLQAA